jgi:metallo-beta-lactamase family protein
MASLSFIGAAQQVTGSCYLLDSPALGRYLLDCGLHQGMDEDSIDRLPRFPFDPTSLDGLILSHAHMDHSGNIPKLVSAGFKGPVYCTRATARMLVVLWEDALGLYEKDLEYENLRRARRGDPALQPAWTHADIVAALRLIKPVAFRECRRLTATATLCFHDSGHILGSAIVELKLTEDGTTRTLVFSGDLGKRNAPLMNDPTLLKSADVVLMEGTYGNRDHRSLPATIAQLEDILHETWARKGNVLIPAFAIGRSQELLYHLARLHAEDKLDPWQIFLDSPMAVQITRIYDECYELLDKEDLARIPPEHRASLKQFLPKLRFAQAVEESLAINNIKHGAIIIAGSGMCTGGRIRHHLKHRIWNERNTLLFAGFQARGTLGRVIVDGARMIRLFGNEFVVRARIETLGGFSAHAGQSDLLHWIGHFSPAPRVLLIHGEPETLKVLQKTLREKLQLDSEIPELGSTIHF